MNKINTFLLLGGMAVATTCASFSVYAKPPVVVAAASSEMRSLQDINQADNKALLKVAGIGKRKAQAIIAYRKEQGSIQSLSELSKIKGMTPAIIKRMKSHFTVIA